MTRPARRLLVVLGAAAGIVALLALLIALSGYDAPRSLAALAWGAVGSRDAVLSATLVRATPLILTGLAVALAFTAGVINIGAEGQLLVGAAAAAAVGVRWGESLGRSGLVAALVAGAIAGAAWTIIPALLRRRGVLEVISTLMMNFVAIHLVGLLVRGPLQEHTHIYPQTESLPIATRLPIVVPGSRLTLGFPIALALAALLWWMLSRTASGFRVRAVGASPSAARSAGEIDVERTATTAFLVSGAIAGLAGAVEVTGVTYALYENLSPGYGYTAIAVALLARLDPLAVAGSGILFGALEAGAAAMQRDAGAPSVLVNVVEAVIILAVIAARRGRSGADG